MALLALSYVGCGHPQVVVKRFRADFDCHGPVRVQRVAGTSYRASGCGDRATYTCSTDSAGGYATSACAREPSARPSRGHGELNQSRARTLEKNTKATVIV